jgi:hypothetical protein
MRNLRAKFDGNIVRDWGPIRLNKKLVGVPVVGGAGEVHPEMYIMAKSRRRFFEISRGGSVPWLNTVVQTKAKEEA